MGILGALLAGVLYCGSVYTAYNIGAAVNDAHWLKEASISKKAVDADLALLRSARDEDSRQAEKLMVETVNEHVQEKTKLAADIKFYRAQSDGLRISAKACRDDRRAMSSTDQDRQGAGTGIDAEDTIRLPVQVESGLWGIMRDAREVVIYYQTCRKLLCADGRCL